LIENREMRVIDLSHRDIEVLPEIIFEFPSVSVLNLHHNRLNDLPCSLDRLKHLRYLDLSHNQFDHFPAAALFLKGEAYLRLGHNRLVSFPDEIVQMTQLNRLIISYNYLCTLPVTLSKLKVLYALYLYAGAFTDWPEVLGDLYLHQLAWRRNSLIEEITREETIPLECNHEEVEEALKSVRYRLEKMIDDEEKAPF
ncbi:MAG: leucine-rich repeat domain-containing protein, partial [Bacteroidota bacterium]